jgi:hypothetical protein
MTFFKLFQVHQADFFRQVESCDKDTSRGILNGFQPSLINNHSVWLLRSNHCCDSLGKEPVRNDLVE